jgi:hypothetical protein
LPDSDPNGGPSKQTELERFIEGWNEFTVQYNAHLETFVDELETNLENLVENIHNAMMKVVDKQDKVVDKQGDATEKFADKVNDLIATGIKVNVTLKEDGRSEVSTSGG